MRIKKNLLVIFGGASSEHDISVMSAKNIVKNISKEDYDLYLVGITKKGRWIYVQRPEELENGQWIYGNKNAYLLPDAEKKAIMIIEDDFEAEVQSVDIEVCFPILHGKNGEDGTIQGLLELSGIPYVGCGILSSATAMDKVSTKIIVEDLGVKQAKYLYFNKHTNTADEVIAKVEKTLKYPVFVKPSNSGSSMGISRATNKEELQKSIKIAAREDSRIVVEEAVVGREIECAIYASDEVKVLGLGEIIAGNDFYDFDAKYLNDSSRTVVDPELEEGVKDKIYEAAKLIFDKMDCHSLSRVDFFVEDKTNEVIFNEINTMPGFTDISMYSMIANSAGISIRELISELLASAFTRKK